MRASTNKNRNQKSVQIGGVTNISQVGFLSSHFNYNIIDSYETSALRNYLNPSVINYSPAKALKKILMRLTNKEDPAVQRPTIVELRSDSQRLSTQLLSLDRRIFFKKNGPPGSTTSAIREPSLSTWLALFKGILIGTNWREI